MSVANGARRPRTVEPLYYSVAEVACLLHVTKRKVFLLIECQILPAKRVGPHPNSPLRISRRAFHREFKD